MFDISNVNGLVQLYRDADSELGSVVLVAYPTDKLDKISFTLDNFEIKIAGEIYKCLFSELTIESATPYDFFEAVELLGEVFNQIYPPEEV